MCHTEKMGKIDVIPKKTEKCDILFRNRNIAGLTMLFFKKQIFLYNYK